MAQGIRQGILATSLGEGPKMKGKEVAKAVADCMAGKANSAMLLLGVWVSYGEVGGRGKIKMGAGELPITEAEGAFDLVDGRAFT